jgi:hypothetical protein
MTQPAEPDEIDYDHDFPERRHHVARRSPTTPQPDLPDEIDYDHDFPGARN